ncbi:MAG: hypothetical protein D4R39_01885 [Methylophilaceae bacterium]|nr:MAG: hypothetical protein D4R39_01885 [Methylophilaceae bacterium]
MKIKADRQQRGDKPVAQNFLANGVLCAVSSLFLVPTRPARPYGGGNSTQRRRKLNTVVDGWRPDGYQKIFLSLK